jgi:hypothetical protein
MVVFYDTDRDFQDKFFPIGYRLEVDHIGGCLAAYGQYMDGDTTGMD